MTLTLRWKNDIIAILSFVKFIQSACNLQILFKNSHLFFSYVFLLCLLVCFFLKKSKQTSARGFQNYSQNLELLFYGPYINIMDAFIYYNLWNLVFHTFGPLYGALNQKRRTGSQFAFNFPKFGSFIRNLRYNVFH